jgi:putative aldouronate transport system permease protein
VSVFNVIITRTYFETSLPNELFEAAKVDGSGYINTFIKIAMPLAKPILAVMVIFAMVAYWNDWFTSLIYMSDKAKYPLQLALRQILIQSEATANAMSGMDGGYAEANRIKELIKYSSMVVGAVPMLIAYPFVQKYFEKGFMVGAVKG